MNIEAQSLDSLRKIVRDLQKENSYLKEQLKKVNIAVPEKHIFEEKVEDSKEYDPDQGGRILNRYVTDLRLYSCHILWRVEVLLTSPNQMEKKS